MNLRLSARLAESAVRALESMARLLPARVATPHIQTGKHGEEEAYFYLRRNGYTIVARNFRSPRRRGEIDLIGWEGEVLCFVEVKTRSTHDVKPAEAAVDADKQQELAAVAREFLRRVPASSYRFDVVSIYLEKAVPSPQITLFKNAFSLP
jgi:putative endonuclease